ncbi:MAG: hypothetical protein EOS07_22095 [Mesorhizobium sp.]|nr:MAG: hypothetical protein EOS07_22095 [Mesorhizobium sp.]
MPKQWEIAQFGQGKEVLKEVGPMGRFIFGLTEYPGLGIDAEPIRATLAAAPEMLAALQTLIGWIDGQIRIGALPAGLDFPAARAALAKAGG